MAPHGVPNNATGDVPGDAAGDALHDDPRNAAGPLRDDAGMAQALDVEAHHALAGSLATQSAVLLKNEGVLPLSPKRKLLFVGDMFRRMRYQGSGSSLIHPPVSTLRRRPWMTGV